MPRIINAYADNSSLADSLSKLGEAIYGDQAKNEVSRQKAFSQKNINDLVTDGTVGLDDPRLAKAQLGIGGTAAGTFPGQGRALANDRVTTGMTVAGGERNNIRNNAETHYSTDRRYASDLATTGMNNASAERVGAGNNAASIAVGKGNNDTQREIELTRDARATQGVLQPDGSVLAYPKSEANANHLPMPQGTDQLNAGVTAMMLRRAADMRDMQKQTSPFTHGAPAWDQPQTAAAPSAPTNGGVSAGMYGNNMSPQLLTRLGQKEMLMIHPGSGKTGSSWDGGSTLADGSSAAGYVPASQEAVLAAEKANNVRKAAAVPLPAAPTGYTQYAQDAYTAGGPGAMIQHDVNAMKGLVGLGEAQPEVNRARENLTNTNNSVRSLYASAPGTRAAVYREKNADRALPDANNFLGITGINSDQQRNKAMSELTHLRQQYELVQADAQDPNTPPEEAAKMLSWMHSARDAIATMSTLPPTPTAGSPAPAGGDLPTLTPEQAAKLPPNTPFLTVDGQHRVTH